MSAPAVTVREATAADDHAIGELLVDAFETTYARKLPHIVYTEGRRAELRAVAKKRAVAQVWVAELEGEIVGTVSVWPPGAEGSEAWLPNAADLRHLAVSPRLHGQGLSAALMDVAERWAWSNGMDAVCLHVRRGVHGVARVYQRRGYARDEQGDLALPEVFLEAYVLRRRD